MTLLTILITRAISHTYADATTLLLSMRSSNVDTAKAFNAIQKCNKGKSTNTTSNRKPNPPGQGKTAPPNKGGCSGSRRMGTTSQGTFTLSATV
ncbi:hypothetical protein L211DRAFT_53297 [Terfezia boudieri ATCC MYA-4762]|uniref:Uncharacterized protein n=1 Tax=Terfezia boudieri ATCC MYA-4762 TaxID=1051890 RepID=A0A3N4M4Q6_9PEZI|nr:hypothetical protein L211DRAFT_53297 [Terfezia boudieri ATCC MYA-4762]